jgi:predicted PurR-regulated permease PerM
MNPGTSDQASPANAPLRRFDVSVRTLVLVPLTAAACIILLRLMPVVLVLVIAMMIMGTLNPAVRWLERHHIKRGWAVLLSFVSLVVVGAALLVLTLAPLISQVEALVSQEPQLREHVADVLSRSSYTASYADRVRHFEYSSLVESTGPQVLVASTRVIEALTYGVSAIFLALYMMIDRDRLRGGLFGVVPRTYHVRFARILLNLETIVGGYIRGQALTCALMAVFTFIILLICKVPNPLALAAFAGFADLLPYIGAMLAVGPAALAAATRGLPTVLIVAGLLFAYQEFESRFIVPRVYGRVLRLPSAVVLIALLAGGVLGGIMGALLALPAAAALRMLLLSSRVLLPGEQVDEEHIRLKDEQAERAYAERTAGVPADEASAVAMELSERRLQDEGELALETPMTGGLLKPRQQLLAADISSTSGGH